MKIGQFITFDLETWDNDIMIMKENKAEITSFCIDPLKLMETKCSVTINNEEFGIPVSCIKHISPAIGEQLDLFTNN